MNKKKGINLKPNQAEMNEHARRLEHYVFQMAADLKKELSEIYKPDGYAQDEGVSGQAVKSIETVKDKWSKIFKKKSKEWSVSMIDTFGTQAYNDVVRSTRGIFSDNTIKASAISNRTKEAAKASADWASSLIVTIPEKYFASVSNGIMKTITQPDQSFSKLKKEINAVLIDEYKTHRNKAKNLALDQTRKCYQGIASNRMKDSGLNMFVWRHSGGSLEPRKDHMRMSGKTYRIDNPPVINKSTGERGLPGDDYNCKCYMQPIIEF